MQFAQIYKIFPRISGTLLCFFVLTVLCQAQPGERLSEAAKSAFEKGDFAPCIKEYTALIARDSKNDSLYAERARCYVSKGSNLQMKIAEKTVLMKTEAAAKKAASAESDAELALALADADKALGLNPGNTAALLVRGVFKTLKKKNREAIEDFSRVIEIEPKSVKAYFNRGGGYESTKEFSKAIDDYTKVIEIDPQNLNAYWRRAFARHRNGVKYKTILTEDLTKIYLTNPKFPLLFATVVDFCLEDGENPGYCAEYFLTPLESDPNDREAKLGFIRTMTKALNKSGYNYDARRKEALTYLLQIMAEEKPDAASYLLLGALYNGLKDYPQAEKNYSQAVRLAPKDEIVFIRRGDFYRQRGENDKAIADYTQAIALKPGIADVYRVRGLAYANINDSVKSLADYNKSLELEPQNALALMNRGNLYYGQKEYPKALADLNQAVTLKAADPCVNSYRGRIYTEMGNFNAAYDDLNHYSNCGYSQFYEGEFEFKKGDYNSAIYKYKRALKDFDYYELDKTPVFAALERAEKLEDERRIKNTVDAPLPTVETVKTVADNSAAQSGETVNQTADQWIESFKQSASQKGLTIINEGTADKLVPYQKSLSKQLLFGASSKHFVLLVFTDDPTYDSFVFVNGEIVTNPFNANGYYVSVPKITQLLNNQYINAVSLGFDTVSRIISVEFRADKPGKVRYILFTQPSETERNNIVASNNQLKYWADLADSQYKQENYAEAIKSYSECLRLKPDAASCFQVRGFSYFNLNKYEEAISDLSRAIQIEPKFADSYAGRGDSYSRLKKYDSAIADYSKAIELDPQDEANYSDRGYVYLQLKKYNEAVFDYSKSIQIKPDATNYYNRGLSYALLNKNDEAIADYSKSIELDAGKSDAYYQRGKVFSLLKRYAEAIADHTKAIQLEPQKANAYFERGYSYQFLKKYDEAIADYTKTIRLKSDYSYAYGNRGAIYYELQKYEQAITDMTKAIEINPKYVNFYQNRVIVYCKQGKIALAQADEQKIIELGGKVINPCR